MAGATGTGKTVTLQIMAQGFSEAGVPVFDADAAVHELYGPGGAATGEIETAFPGTTGAEGVDRAKLSAALACDPQGFEKLEAIVHPLVAAARETFLDDARAAGHWGVILDIPLLFETGQEDAFDVIIVVTAPEKVQRERVLSRPGMSEAKFAAILARQTPDSDKRARADHVIDTSRGIEDARAQVLDIIAALRPAANGGKR